jgi:hypothetical protein
MADVSTYLNLITSEHRDKPLYTAMVAAIAQCWVDNINLLQSLPGKFDLDNAQGSQLDVDGLWLGLLRTIRTPLPDVFFTLDSDDLSLGLDAGIWFSPISPQWGVSQFDDNSFRLLLRAKAVANRWDGSLPSMVDILREIFAPATVDVVEGDMSIAVTITGTPPSTLFKYLVQEGYLPLKPSGVSISYTFA